MLEDLPHLVQMLEVGQHRLHAQLAWSGFRLHPSTYGLHGAGGEWQAHVVGVVEEMFTQGQPVEDEVGVLLAVAGSPADEVEGALADQHHLARSRRSPSRPR